MPLTMRQHEANLRQPAFCELLPIRDYLDNVIVRSNGALVAGYDLGGINSYYHSDETRNQTKYSLEALVRSLRERSMRMQVRFEVVEGLGDLPAHYRDQLRSDNPVVQSLDRVRLAAWKQKEQSGFYLHAETARVRFGTSGNWCGSGSRAGTFRLSQRPNAASGGRSRNPSRRATSRI